MTLAVLIVLVLAFVAVAAQQQRPHTDSSVSVSSAPFTTSSVSSNVPAVFHNGAWDPDHSTARNAYVAALLSKDVYHKHIIDPRDGAAARRNFTLFSELFCRSMARLGADECEAVAGANSLVWALVRAGPSVMLVVRGSNTPQNWITDLVSLRTTNVGDFGGGAAGTNVALGFYEAFSANRRVMMDRVRRSMTSATAAAVAAAAAGDDGAAGAADGAAGARLWVFGHSLGGAVALMAASYLDVREGLTPTGVYVFGCPRAGDSSWARTYRLHDITLRLENAGDIVPTLPFGTAWRHVGSPIAIRDCGGLALPGEHVRQSAGGPAVQRRRLRGVVNRHVAVSATDAEAEEAVAAATAALAAASAAVSAAGTASERVGFAAAGTTGGSSEEVAVSAVVADVSFPFPFPFSIEDHMIETYVRVMWSCLPEADQDMVPGPADVYGV